MLVCLEGDELPPMLRAPTPYTAPPFVTPGTGTISARARAMQPAPAGPVLDPVAKKPGMAEFITTYW